MLLENLADTKVGKDSFVFVVQKNVFWFNVSVANLSNFMAVAKGRNNLSKDLLGLSGFETILIFWPVKKSLDGSVWHVVCDDDQLAFGFLFNDFVEAHNVIMLEPF